MEDELQGTQLVLLARRGCLSLGDGGRKTWAAERSALQVGHDIGMTSFLTCRHHTEGVFLSDTSWLCVIVLIEPSGRKHVLIL